MAAELYELRECEASTLNRIENQEKSVQGWIGEAWQEIAERINEKHGESFTGATLRAAYRYDKPSRSIVKLAGGREFALTLCEALHLEYLDGSGVRTAELYDEVMKEIAERLTLKEGRQFKKNDLKRFHLRRGKRGSFDTKLVEVQGGERG